MPGSADDGRIHVVWETDDLFQSGQLTPRRNQALGGTLEQKKAPAKKMWSIGIPHRM